MTPEDGITPQGGPPGDEADTGAPIVELRDLSLAVGDRFGRHVQGRIERRVLTGEFLGLAWTAPVMMLLEFLRAPFELLGERRHK
jgi:hypothetical protein